MPLAIRSKDSKLFRFLLFLLIVIFIASRLNGFQAANPPSVVPSFISQMLGALNKYHPFGRGADTLPTKPISMAVEEGSIKGDVFIEKNFSRIELYNGVEVREGNSIITLKDAFVTLTLDNSRRYIVGGDSVVDLDILRVANGEIISFMTLRAGDMVVALNKPLNAPARNEIQVYRGGGLLPVVSAAVGTSYALSRDDAGNVDIFVFTGVVTALGSDGTQVHIVPGEIGVFTPEDVAVRKLTADEIYALPDAALAYMESQYDREAINDLVNKDYRNDLDIAAKVEKSGNYLFLAEDESFGDLVKNNESLSTLSHRLTDATPPVPVSNDSSSNTDIVNGAVLKFEENQLKIVDNPGSGNPADDQEAVIDGVPVDEPVIDDVPVDEPVIDDVPVDEPVIDDVPVDEPVIDDVPVDEPVIDVVPDAPTPDATLDAARSKPRQEDKANGSQSQTERLQQLQIAELELADLRNQFEKQQLVVATAKTNLHIFYQEVADQEKVVLEAENTMNQLVENVTAIKNANIAAKNNFEQRLMEAETALLNQTMIVEQEQAILDEMRVKYHLQEQRVNEALEYAHETALACQEKLSYMKEMTQAYEELEKRYDQAYAEKWSALSEQIEQLSVEVRDLEDRIKRSEATNADISDRRDQAMSAMQVALAKQTQIDYDMTLLQNELDRAINQQNFLMGETNPDLIKISESAERISFVTSLLLACQADAAQMTLEINELKTTLELYPAMLTDKQKAIWQINADMEEIKETQQTLQDESIETSERIGLLLAEGKILQSQLSELEKDIQIDIEWKDGIQKSIDEVNQSIANELAYQASLNANHNSNLFNESDKRLTELLKKQASLAEQKSEVDETLAFKNQSLNDLSMQREEQRVSLQSLQERQNEILQQGNDLENRYISAHDALVLEENAYNAMLASQAEKDHALQEKEETAREILHKQDVLERDLTDEQVLYNALAANHKASVEENERSVEDATLKMTDLASESVRVKDDVARLEDNYNEIMNQLAASDRSLAEDIESKTIAEDEWRVLLDKYEKGDLPELKDLLSELSVTRNNAQEAEGEYAAAEALSQSIADEADEGQWLLSQKEADINGQVEKVAVEEKRREEIEEEKAQLIEASDEIAELGAENERKALEALDRQGKTLDEAETFLNEMNEELRLTEAEAQKEANTLTQIENDMAKATALVDELKERN